MGYHIQTHFITAEKVKAIGRGDAEKGIAVCDKLQAFFDADFRKRHPEVKLNPRRTAVQLTPQEIELLRAPIASLDKPELALAIMAWDKRNSINSTENEIHRQHEKAAHKARFKDAA